LSLKGRHVDEAEKDFRLCGNETEGSGEAPRRV
jgi:hypothetical protein